MKVWILVFYMTRYAQDGGPVLIDNIATLAECQRVQKVVDAHPLAWKKSQCIEVQKAKP